METKDASMKRLKNFYFFEKNMDFFEISLIILYENEVEYSIIKYDIN